jgi:hypothetical protein
VTSRRERIGGVADILIAYPRSTPQRAADVVRRRVASVAIMVVASLWSATCSRPGASNAEMPRYSVDKSSSDWVATFTVDGVIRAHLTCDAKADG